MTQSDNSSSSANRSTPSNYPDNHPLLRKAEEKAKSRQTSTTDVSPITVLGLSTHTRRKLKLAGIETVNQLTDLTEEQLLGISGIGEKSITEITLKLVNYLGEHQLPQEPETKGKNKSPQTHATTASSINVLRPQRALKWTHIDSIDQLSKGEILGYISITEIEEELANHIDAQPKAPVDKEPSELPTKPLIISDRLESLSDIPIDSISVDRLALPDREAYHLTHQGITSIGKLAQQSADAFAKDSLITDRLTRYLNWLTEQDEKTWDIEVSGKSISPIYRIMLSEITLDALIDTWLGFLTTDSQHDVLRYRLGRDGAKMSLKETSHQMGMPRNQVRHLETKAFHNLSIYKAQQIIAPLVQFLVQVFNEAGGLMTEKEICQSLIELIAAENINITWTARLLLAVSDPFQEMTFDGVWGLASTPQDLVLPIRWELVDLLEESDGQARRDRLLTRFMDTTFQQEHSGDYNDEFVEACLRTHPQIECVEGICVLRKRDLRHSARTGAVRNVPQRLKPAPLLPSKQQSTHLITQSEVPIDKEQAESTTSTQAGPQHIESSKNAPIDSISVDRLILPTSEANYLDHLNIASIGELVRQPDDAFDQGSLITDRLKLYFDWLVEQDEVEWEKEVSGDCISPIYRLTLSESALDALIDAWLEPLTPREQEILRYRMGCDSPKMTLAKLGEQMGVTREHIRQLESRALNKLSNHKLPQTITLIQFLVQAFNDAGGLMTEQEICDRLVDLITVEMTDATWAIRLMLTVDNRFQKMPRDGLWGLTTAPLELVPLVKQMLMEILRDMGGLASYRQLMTSFTETILHQEYGVNYSETFIEACLRTHSGIECAEGQCMIRKHYCRRSSSTEIIQAIQEREQPEPRPEPASKSISKPAAPKASKPKSEFVIELKDVEPLDRPPETLEEWEQHLRPQISRVELLGELALTDRERAELGELIGLIVQELGHGRAVRRLRSEYPCALAVYLAAQGVYGYEAGDYWTEVVEATGFTPARMSAVGQAFEDIVEALGLPLFYDLRAEAHRYISLILAHGGIPNYCLPDFFANMLQPSVLRARYADMSAAELIDEWRWRSSVRYFTDKPVIRFLIYGGRVAEDFVERCREMAWSYLDSGVMPSPEEVGLPRRVVEAYDEWIAAQDAEKVKRDTGDRWRLRKPQLLVDPWGEGVLVDLPPQQVPATEIYAAIEWQVTADEETNHVPVHVRRVGFDRRTEAQQLPLTRPAKEIEVTLLVDGGEKRTWRYQGFDEEKPLLAFDPERSTLLSWTHSLPAGHLGLLYPAHLELQVEGDGRLLEELRRLPWGWSGFRGERWDLAHATRLILRKEGEEVLDVPLQPDEAAQRPSLEGGQPFSPQDSEERAPVYVGAPPRIRVPLTGRQTVDEELARWRLRVRNKWSAIPEVDVAVSLAELKPALEVTENHVALPLSLSSLLGEAPYGSFAVQLRGPLGRDAGFTLRMIPHFVLCGHEELYLPIRQDGPQPATLLVETLPGDRIECQGEEAACQVQGTERGELAWQHEVEVGPEVTEVELTVVHPHPSGEAVRVPVRVPIRRLRWALVDEETVARRGVWTGSIIKRPIEALRQLRSPLLLVKLPLRAQDTEGVQLGLRLLNVEGDELQATDRATLAGRQLTVRFDLGAFLDTIRTSRSPILRLELSIWGLPERDQSLRLPVLSLTQTLLVEDVDLSFRVVGGRPIFDLTWNEPAPLRNRHVRFWPLWRPWDPFFEQEIPDGAEGSCSFEVPPSKLKSGKYRLEFLVVDPWATQDETPQRPQRDTPSTADAELIAADKQLEVLSDRLQKQGPGFDLLLSRAAIYHDTGAVKKAIPDCQWCYEHLDEGTIPQALALVDLIRDTGDEDLTQALQLKLFASRRVEQLLALRETGEVSRDHFESYLANVPRSGMLPLATCRQLLAVEEETVRLHAVQQLIHREDPMGPEAVVRWVEDAQMSDADAVSLLVLNVEFSVEVLKGDLNNPVTARLLKRLAPEMGDRTPIVQPGTWVYTDVGWGLIDRIEDQAGDPVQQYLSGQTGYRLHVILRPAVDAEPVVVDLERKLITFVNANAIHTCIKCNGFSARNRYLIVNRHDRIAHDGVSPRYREERITKRSLRRLTYSARPPVKRGLGIP